MLGLLTVLPELERRSGALKTVKCVARLTANSWNEEMIVEIETDVDLGRQNRASYIVPSGRHRVQSRVVTSGFKMTQTNSSSPSLKGLDILIISPHALAREGLRLLVGQDEDLHVLGTAANADDAFESLRYARADVVIVAHSSDNQQCIACVQRIKTAQHDSPVLVITADTRPEQVQAALAAGATGYLPLDAEPDELLRAIYTVSRGELALHATIVSRLLSHLGARRAEDSQPAHDDDDLTPREREILAHLARGLSDQDIAQSLFISVRTVQSHLSHIYAKLNIHSRTEAALTAVREGWVSPIEGQ